MISCHIMCVCPLFHYSRKWLQEPLSLVYISAFSFLFLAFSYRLSSLLFSPPPFISVFPSQSFPIFLISSLFGKLSFSFCLLFVCLASLFLSLSSIATHFCFLWSVKNDRLHNEVDRIRRRNGLTKWIAAFLAIHHRSEATAVKICEGSGLLITSCNYKVSDAVFVAWQGGGGSWGRWLVVGGMQAAVALSKILFW